MSKLRERLEEGKQFTPERSSDIGYVRDVLFLASREMAEIVKNLRLLRRTTKAYRGKELKKLEDEARKFMSALDITKETIKDDKIIAKKKMKNWS
jgi:hypothetical protein